MGSEVAGVAGHFTDQALNPVGILARSFHSPSEIDGTNELPGSLYGAAPFSELHEVAWGRVHRRDGSPAGA